MGFSDIKKILNDAMSASKATIGAVDLKQKHKEPSFPAFDGDFTKDDLLKGKARGLDLIQNEVKGPLGGPPGNKGNQANIVRALRGELPGVRQMPGGGPPVDDTKIKVIEDWINHGCPD
jgi:hypothetical protein